jgi:hypothetical protein
MDRNSYRYTGMFILVLFSIYNAFSQTDTVLVNAEREIKYTFSKITNLSSFKREESANKVFETFFNTLQNERSFEYPFDSLKKVGKIYSPDHRLRIYSWNIPIGIDQNLYYSIIQFYSKEEKIYLTIKLKSAFAATSPVTVENWPGALYYEIVETKHAGQKYYTLLGLDLGNMLTNKKVIDVVSIDDFDVFYFCRSLIKYDGRLTDRLVFEFNEQVNMTLKYNHTEDMIVFDHLSPEKPSFEGNYAYYGPDFTYDGLKFEKGIWVHYKNIVITN